MLLPEGQGHFIIFLASDWKGKGEIHVGLALTDPETSPILPLEWQLQGTGAVSRSGQDSALPPQTGSFLRVTLCLKPSPAFWFLRLTKGKPMEQRGCPSTVQQQGKVNLVGRLPAGEDGLVPRIGWGHTCSELC